MGSKNWHCLALPVPCMSCAGFASRDSRAGVSPPEPVNSAAIRRGNRWRFGASNPGKQPIRVSPWASSMKRLGLSFSGSFALLSLLAHCLPACSSDEPAHPSGTAGSSAGTPAVAGAPSSNGGSTTTAGAGPSSGGAGNGGSATGSAGSPTTAGSANGGASAAGAVGSSGGATGSAGGSTGSAGGSTGPAGAGNAPLFSDGFESTSIDSTKWTPRLNGNGMFSLDATQKHSGSQSLHLKHMGFSSMLAFEGSLIFPAPNNTFYARLWLRVTGPLPQGHVVWFEAGDITNDTHEVRVGMNIGKFQSNLYYQGEVDIRDPEAKVMAATWQCVQVKYGPNVLDVSLDGTHSSISTTTWVAADQANGSTTVPKSNWAPTYASFRIGWELGDGEIWFDDVALSHSPIPCN